MTHQWPTSTWKHGHRQRSLGRRNSTLQWDATSHPLEWLELYKQGKQQVLARMWRNGNPWTLMAAMKTVQLLWKTVWCFLRELNRITVGPSNFTPRHIPKGSENRYSCTYRPICSSATHNSQKAEKTQMSLKGWMDKHTVADTCRKIFSHDKEWSTDTCYHLGKPQKHYAKRKVSDTKNVTCHMIPFTRNISSGQTHRYKK